MHLLLDIYMLHVGNQCVHYSHTLAVHRGLVYCSKCGYKGGANQVRKLTKPCAPSGVRNLKAVRDGKLPPGLEEWPHSADDDGSLSDGSLTLL